jgi:hypothetical protein
VDGDDTLDACLLESDRQFSGKTVKDLYTIFLEVFDDTVASPEGLEE